MAHAKFLLLQVMHFPILVWSPLFLESPHVRLHTDNNENSEWSLIAERAQQSLLLQEDPVLAGVAQGFVV